MRIDPAAVFVHTLASLPARVAVVWIVGALGAFSPILFRDGGFGNIDVFLGQLAFLPVYLLWATLDGWWTLLTLPLLLAFLWHAVIFIRDDDSTADLFWIFMPPCLISLPAHGSLGTSVVLLTAASLFLVIRRYRRQGIPGT